MNEPDIQVAMQRLIELIDEADPRLRARKEHAAAKQTVRDLQDSSEEPEDVLRRLNAAHDLLKLAEAECDQEVRQEEAFKRSRLREDEALLEALEKEVKVSTALIGFAYVTPPVFLGPIGVWCGVFAAPGLWAVSRLVKARGAYDGRAWLVLNDRVEDTTRKVDFALLAAGLSLALSLAWVIFAVLRADAA